MGLHTGSAIIRQHVLMLPLTPLAKQAVETYAAQQGIKSLKITTKTGIEIRDPNWIEGADYE